jgi:hypothetical protein
MLYFLKKNIVFLFRLVDFCLEGCTVDRKYKQAYKKECQHGTTQYTGGPLGLQNREYLATCNTAKGLRKNHYLIFK